MKRIFASFCFLLFFVFVGILGTWEARYTKTVKCIKYKNNVYTFIDSNNHTWLWDSTAEDFQFDKNYKLIMDDNHTPNNIYDDRIIAIKTIDK